MDPIDEIKVLKQEIESTKTQRDKSKGLLQSAEERLEEEFNLKEGDLDDELKKVDQEIEEVEAELTRAFDTLRGEYEW